MQATHKGLARPLSHDAMAPAKGGGGIFPLMLANGFTDATADTRVKIFTVYKLRNYIFLVNFISEHVHEVWNVILGSYSFPLTWQNGFVKDLADSVFIYFRHKAPIGNHVAFDQKYIGFKLIVNTCHQIVQFRLLTHDKRVNKMKSKYLQNLCTWSKKDVSQWYWKNITVFYFE